MTCVQNENKLNMEVGYGGRVQVAQWWAGNLGEEMSTRCCIHIQQPDDTFKKYYHHFDGYMSGVGSVLYGIPKKQRTSLRSIVSHLTKFYRREYEIVKYNSGKNDMNKMQLEYFEDQDPFGIEWLYRILKNGNLEIESINTGEIFKIASRKHFDFLVQHTEKELQD